MLNFKNIKKSFGDNEVLKNVSLTVPTGKVVVILGPSGSGKTTLLRCANFLEVPNSGTVNLDDISIDSTNYKKDEIYDLRKNVTMVFQNYNVFKNSGTFCWHFLSVCQSRGRTFCTSRKQSSGKYGGLYSGSYEAFY